MAEQNKQVTDQKLYDKLSKWFEARDQYIKAQSEYRTLCSEINQSLDMYKVKPWVTIAVYSEQEGADIEYYNILSDDQGRIKVF